MQVLRELGCVVLGSQEIGFPGWEACRWELGPYVHIEKTLLRHTELSHFQMPLLTLYWVRDTPFWNQLSFFHWQELISAWGTGLCLWFRGTLTLSQALPSPPVWPTYVLI